MALAIQQLALQSPTSVFEPQFAQRALLAVAVVSLLAAAIGPSVVLLDLPFFTHAIGAGAYPVMVGAVALGVALTVGALIGAAVFALVVLTITSRSTDGGRRDALTGVAIVAALAVGAIIAAVGVPADSRLALSPEALLFGSVLTVGDDVIYTVVAVALVVVPTAVMFGERWLAAGFDPQVAGQLDSSASNIALIVCVAVAAGATLPVTGSLLAGALLVIPAATARILFNRFAVLMPATFLIALTEGVIGLYLAFVLDLPPGAAIALVAGIGFVLAAIAKTLIGRMLVLRSASKRTGRTAMAAVAVVGLMLTAYGCGGSSGTNGADDNDERILVVATTPQIADIAAGVGGDAIEVETLMPAGTDPHDFEPRPSDIAKLDEADVILRSGGELDEWVVGAARTAGATKSPVDLSQAARLIPSEGEHSHEAGDEQEEAHGDEAEADETFNAHWYLAPSNVAAAARRVRDEFVKATPSARESTRANADQYIAGFEALSAELSECAAKVPAEQRVFVSGHDDFAYLADAFDFDVSAQIAPTGRSEPSARELQESVDDARSAGTRAVVTSSGETTQLATTVADRLNVPLLELYADSLADSGEASTLEGAIRYDVTRLVDAASGGVVDCGEAS